MGAGRDSEPPAGSPSSEPLRIDHSFAHRVGATVRIDSRIESLPESASAAPRFAGPQVSFSFWRPPADLLQSTSPNRPP